MKRVFLKGRPKGGITHSLYEELLRNPPDGYQIFAERNKDSTESKKKTIYTERQYQFDRFNQRFLSYNLTREVWREIRTLLYMGIKSAKSLGMNEPPSDLVYASQQFVSGDRPWLVDFEFVNALVDYGDIRLGRRWVKKALASRFCKKIIPWSEWSKRTLLRSLDCSSFKEKIEVIHFATRAKKFAKKKENSKIRLLFVGSINQQHFKNFEWKGGIEAVEALPRLHKKYDVELVVRSWVPPEIAVKCAKDPNIKLISSKLSSEELSDLYLSSDIFMFPSYLNLGMVILEAMSYELAPIAPNIFDVPEAVKDMKTGVLLDSPKLPFYAWNGAPNDHDPQVLAGVRRFRNWRISQIVEKTSMLIEDDVLRRQISRNARRLVEEGEFSLSCRNQKLRKIFDEATQPR